MKEFNFVFTDEETGEVFMVQIIGEKKAPSLKAAKDIAAENFESPIYEYLATPE